jgi:ATP-dependent Lhr-like helicase
LMEHANEEVLPPAVSEWLRQQSERSSLPDRHTLLVESFEHERMQHCVFYSFAGRNANQTLGLLLSQRMEALGLLPLGFIANDYALLHWGLRAITDPQTLLNEALAQDNSENWIETSQMARRAFRDIAVIAGLIERRHPGKKKTGRQVTMSSDLLYDVLRKYEPDHVLLSATREDVLHKLADIDRLRELVETQPVRHKQLQRVSPLAVPLMLELGIEKIKGEGETALLDAQSLLQAGDELFREAVS